MRPELDGAGEWPCSLQGAAPAGGSTPRPHPQALYLYPGSMRFRCTWQAVGDALSGVLLVEAALRILGWTLSDWAATYADLPSRQLKVGQWLLIHGYDTKP